MALVMNALVPGIDSEAQSCLGRRPSTYLGRWLSEDGGAHGIDGVSWARHGVFPKAWRADGDRSGEFVHNEGVEHLWQGTNDTTHACAMRNKHTVHGSERAQLDPDPSPDPYLCPYPQQTARLSLARVPRAASRHSRHSLSV